MSEDQPKVSAYVKAGLPKQCFLPLCWSPFTEKAIHARDGHYYCSEECLAQGTKLDLSQVEELASKARKRAHDAPSVPQVGQGRVPIMSRVLRKP
jgi:hypothetical protein